MLGRSALGQGRPQSLESWTHSSHNKNSSKPTNLNLHVLSGSHVATQKYADPAIAGVQKAWVATIVSRKRELVLSTAQNQVGRARLIVVAAPHSGDFLHAIPCSSVGTRLDDLSLIHI